MYFNASFLYEQLIRDHKVDDSSHDFGKDLIPYLVPRLPHICTPVFKQLREYRWHRECHIGET